ncbi:MAG TPA: DUF2157 domain-containing protein [Cyclobacteriaceae bacterium]|nr:DUF2157 domain-containing protein [Cyclobacteriaceae bacterium]
MTKNLPEELLVKNLITQEQFAKVKPIVSGKIISLFYELRTLLYLGVMLFTAGAGILIYKNIGELGHVAAILSPTALMIGCFWYVYRTGPAYSNEIVKGPTPYFDYVLLLASLLFVSIQGYLQFQYAILDDNLGTSTLITALLFFYLAYRYDHTGLLSLGITSFVSFWGVSVSPVKWYSGSFFEQANLHVIAMILGVALSVASIFLHHRSVKKHFTFTYLNFSLLMFFCAAVAGLFIDGGIYGIYILLIYGGCAFSYYAARLSRSFLFLLYAFIAAYIATTFFLVVTLQIYNSEYLWFWYSIFSCGGFVYFIIRFKNHFRQPS